ncbi:MAG: hypothetical protein ABI556_13790 [Gemmatimonadales bacterium]
MKRSSREQLMLVLSTFFAIAPFGFGVLRYLSRAESTGLWMAIASAAGAVIVRVVANARGVRGSTVAVVMSTLAISTILAGAAGILLGSSAVGVWMVAFVIGLCWMAASVFAALSQPASTL